MIASLATQNFVLKYESGPVSLFRFKFKSNCSKYYINQVRYESYHVSLLRDSAMSNVVNFCFLSIFIVA